MEKNLKICKTCNQLKTRIEDGKYNNCKDKKYINEEGQLWNGRICPSCNLERVKNKMKEKRSKILP